MITFDVNTADFKRLEKKLGDLGSAVSDARNFKDEIIGSILQQYRVGRRYKNRTGRMSRSLLSTTGPDTYVSVTQHMVTFETRVPYAVYLMAGGWIVPIDKRKIAEVIRRKLEAMRRGARMVGT